MSTLFETKFHIVYLPSHYIVKCLIRANFQSMELFPSSPPVLLLLLFSRVFLPNHSNSFPSSSPTSFSSVPALMHYPAQLIFPLPRIALLILLSIFLLHCSNLFHSLTPLPIHSTNTTYFACL